MCSVWLIGKKLFFSYQVLIYGYLQIIIRDSKGLSEEQIKEFRSSFNHFDKVCPMYYLCDIIFCFYTILSCMHATQVTFETLCN